MRQFYWPLVLSPISCSQVVSFDRDAGEECVIRGKMSLACSQAFCVYSEGLVNLVRAVLY